MPRGKLKTSDGKDMFVFALHFIDGRTEEIEVSAASFPAAVLSLPRFSEVGKYKYTLVKGKAG